MQLTSYFVGNLLDLPCLRHGLPDLHVGRKELIRSHPNAQAHMRTEIALGHAYFR